MAAQFTMRNKRRNITSALAATVLRSSVSVMILLFKQKTAYEMCGVRFRAWSLPRARGRPPSRPIANATRLEEKIREFRAARAPNATPKTMIGVPNGMTCAAISAIALLLPVGPAGDPCRSKHDALGPPLQFPEIPIATNATEMKIRVERPIT